MTATPESVLTKSQFRIYGPRACPNAGHGALAMIRAKVRYDDQCGNGHNSFAITGEIYVPDRREIVACGSLHEEIAKYFPELASHIKWHLCNSDGPMHYIANTVYHAQSGKLEYARSSAIWPDATLEQLHDKAALEARLPALMREFRAAVESLGFTY